MPQIAAYEDVAPNRIIRNRGSDPDHPSADVYPLIGQPRDADGRGPNAFLVRYIPGTTSSTHYHASDQMQIIVEGKGSLGHHPLTPYQVHFSRAYTPYGPLLPDATEGWAFVNLRTRPDPGAQRLPHKREQLLQVKDRRPFQVTCTVDFPPVAGGPSTADIEGLRNEEGLRGYALTLGPNARATAVPAAGSDGQYVVVVEGSVVDGQALRNALAIIHVAPEEPAFQIVAGPEGLKAMVVNFPRVGAPAVVERPVDARAADKVWSCLMCDFTYDESVGMPEEGIPAGTRWEDVPESWTCPDCGVTKADFVLVEF